MNRGGSSDWRPTSPVTDSLLTGTTPAIGCTLAGLHRFNYRKFARHSLPGDTFVLHPDELHDGEPVMKRVPLPHRLHRARLVAGPAGRPAAALHRRRRIPRPAPAASHWQPVAVSGPATRGVGGRGCAIRPRSGDGLDRRDEGAAAQRRFPRGRAGRDYIHEFLTQPVSLDELEQVSGRDRWSLSRDFRALFGTSPYRYLTLRRLDGVRRLLLGATRPARCADRRFRRSESHEPPVQTGLWAFAGALAAADPPILNHLVCTIVQDASARHDRDWP